MFGEKKIYVRPWWIVKQKLAHQKPCKAITTVTHKTPENESMFSEAK